MAGVIFWDGVLDQVAKDFVIAPWQLISDDDNVVGSTGRDYDVNPWNVVSFDDIPLPGICEVKGLPKCKVKSKKAPGSKGNRPTLLGYDPIEFDITCTIWTSSQWDIMQDLIDTLWNKPLANPRYIGRTRNIDPAQFTHAVDYPSLQAFMIRYAVITQFGLPREGKVPGAMQFDIKCLENRDPGNRNVTATPKPAAVKRHKNFDGPRPLNSSQLPPPSYTPANMSLAPQLSTPADGLPP